VLVRELVEQRGRERGGGGVLERGHAAMVPRRAVSIQCFGLARPFIFDMVCACRLRCLH
jgi:hypothetical protein